MFVYNAVAIPLLLSFLSIALLWRNQQAKAAAEREDVAYGATLVFEAV